MTTSSGSGGSSSGGGSDSGSSSSIDCGGSSSGNSKQRYVKRPILRDCEVCVLGPFIGHHIEVLIRWVRGFSSARQVQHYLLPDNRKQIRLRGVFYHTYIHTNIIHKVRLSVLVRL